MASSLRVVAGLLVVLVGQTAFGQSPDRQVPREFDHVRTLGRALSQYEDDTIQVAAAYYYSQSNHDSPWLLIELGAMGRRLPTKIDRDGIEIITPGGRVVPLATQARWSVESQRAAQLLQQAHITRHQVGWYFKATNGTTGLRFFIYPPGAGTVLDFADIAPNQLAYGDLLFESPTRLWDKGTYALVVRYAGGEAMLPIELR